MRELHLLHHVPHPSCTGGVGRGGMLPVARTDLQLQEPPLTEAASRAEGERSLPKMDALSFRAGACRTERPDPPTLCQRRRINSALITQPIFLRDATPPRPTNHRGPRCLIEFPSAVCALPSADQRCRELRLCSPLLSEGIPGTRGRNAVLEPEHERV